MEDAKKDGDTLTRDMNTRTLFKVLAISIGIIFVLVLIGYASYYLFSTSDECSNSNQTGSCLLGTTCAANASGTFVCLQECSEYVQCPEGSICSFSGEKQVCL